MQKSRKTDNLQFVYLKKFVASQSLRSDQETKGAVQNWLEGLAMTFFEDNLQKLVPRYDKCLNVHGDYVEK
jgi:hypothetical protein